MAKSQWLMATPLAATNAKADTPLFPFIARLMRGENLNAPEAAKFFQALTDPSTGSNQIAAALTALTAKGETFEELAGMATVMRTLTEKVKTPKFVVDIAGTGSSTARTFNVSTAAAIVAAGAGLSVAKQSNRGIHTKVGSADVLGELGVKPSQTPQGAQASMTGTGLSFIFTPKFFPTLRRLADVRSSLGIRTCLNILGLLANPAAPTRMLIGVWHKSLVEPVAKALSLLKAENAWVVYGSDGLDEVTLSGKTYVGAVKGTDVRPFVVSPTDFGLKAAKIEDLKSETAKESARIIREVFSGKRRDEARSLIVINAASALIIGGIATDPIQAARLAERSIDSGQAQNKLDRLVQITNKN